jgi:hypothetical protein
LVVECSISDFAIYKLKEMGKICDKDITDVFNQFSTIEGAKCGKIRLSDLAKWNDKNSPYYQYSSFVGGGVQG